MIHMTAFQVTARDCCHGMRAIRAVLTAAACLVATCSDFRLLCQHHMLRHDCEPSHCPLPWSVHVQGADRFIRRALMDMVSLIQLLMFHRSYLRDQIFLKATARMLNCCRCCCRW